MSLVQTWTLVDNATHFEWRYIIGSITVLYII